MTDLLSNTLKVIISFFVVLILNKILSLFRKRQLYLSCWNSLESTSVSNNAFTMNASIYNNGKDKEKNVVIKMPSGLSCSVISSSYDYKNENGEIIFDRILPSQKVSLIILVEGARKLERSIRPRIKSEDANGKVYLTQDLVPPSAGVLTVTIAIVTTFVGGFTYIVRTGDSPEKAIAYVHNSLFYMDYKSSGFFISPFGNDVILKNYDIKNKEYPIELIDARRINKKIQYKFRLVNKLNNPMEFSSDFKISSNFSFWREMSSTTDLIDESIAQKVKKELFDKYHVSSEFINDKIYYGPGQKATVKANSMGYMILSRDDKDYLSLDDMNVDITIQTPDGLINKKTELYFDSSINKITRALFE